MRYALFLIEETNEGQTYARHYNEAWDCFYTLKEARAALMYRLNILAKCERANDLQPTMNHKDRFHYWEGSRKKHLVISKYYKAARNSIFMVNNALEKIK